MTEAGALDLISEDEEEGEEAGADIKLPGVHRGPCVYKHESFHHAPNKPVIPVVFVFLVMATSLIYSLVPRAHPKMGEGLVDETTYLRASRI